MISLLDTAQQRHHKTGRARFPDHRGSCRVSRVGVEGMALRVRECVRDCGVVQVLIWPQGGKTRRDTRGCMRIKILRSTRRPPLPRPSSASVTSGEASGSDLRASCELAALSALSRHRDHRHTDICMINLQRRTRIRSTQHTFCTSPILREYITSAPRPRPP